MNLSSWGGFPRDADRLALYRRILRAGGADGDGTDLDDLVEAGFLQRRGNRIVPVRPSAAANRWLQQQIARLAQVSQMASDLDYPYEVGQLADGSRHGPFQLLRGPEIKQFLYDAVERATSHIDVIDAPPYISRPDDRQLAAEYAARARGIQFRTVVHRDAYDDPVHLQDLMSSLDQGDAISLSQNGLTKMMVVDSEDAIIPILGMADIEEPTVVYLKQVEIVQILQTCFNMQFAQGTPLVASDPTRNDANVPSNDHRLVQLLLNGASDAAIMRALNVSDRTFRRKVAALQQQHGARTRFQLGAIIGHAHTPPRI